MSFGPAGLDSLYPESHVLVIITGGTICMRRSEDGLVPAKGFLQSGLAPRPVFNDNSFPDPLEIFVDDSGTRKAVQSLRVPPSAYGRRVRYAVQEFDPLLDSSSIDSAGWDLIARAIYRNYQLFDGFVILHGTDSLAYTSSALSFMLQNLGKPVILTGSQTPMLELQNDATDNLLSSLVIAGHFMVPEVCLFFNFKLFRGNRATKVSADDFNAFASPNHPALATITSLKTKVAWDLVFRPTSVDAFSITTNLDGNVASLRLFPGIKVDMVDAVLKSDGLRGLVLETFGSGNAPGGNDGALTKVLANAVERGIIIVNITQCLSGTVSPLYAPATDLGRAGVIFGHDMTSEAALTKLQYLISLPELSVSDVAKQMSVSLRGELTETSQTHFQHPPSSGTLTPELQSLSAMNFAVQKGDLMEVKFIMEKESRWLLNDGDYSGCTPLHIAATSPNLELLSFFLSQGASVHLRNRAGHTPLFLAAQTAQLEHVRLLREAGAHLHSEEIREARYLAERSAETLGEHVWAAAGVTRSNP